MPFIDAADGTRLFYRDWGRGRPIVLVHGWALNGDIWERQMLDLTARGFRCIVHDRRGFGRSDQPGQGYDYDVLADDLARLLDRLDLEGVTLVGHSMGGGEVVRYLTRHGSRRVAGAVLAASTTPLMRRGPDNPDGIDPEVFDGMAAALRRDRPAFMAASAAGFFGEQAEDGPVSDALVAWAVGLALQASAAATLATIPTFSATDFRAEMPAVTVPTLVVHGAADQNVPVDLCARQGARLLPRAELTIYEGAAHGLILTHAGRFNDDLARFAAA
jgi:pimeloyl-ACP methyl ester carboxylesterase